MKKTIGIVFGGRSGEHEISIRSAKAVFPLLDPSKYFAIPIAISADGKWLNPYESAGLLGDAISAEFVGEFEEYKETTVGLIGDSTRKGLIVERGTNSEILKIDVFFPILHGTYGEDGTIQGLFEMADIAYVGCGVTASSCGMDKTVMKSLFRDAGLPICKYVWFTRKDWFNAPETTISNIEKELGFPCFVKPANLGSSVGISNVKAKDELAAAIDLAAQYDTKIVVEESLVMREIECAVIGNDIVEASRPGEYIIRNSSKAFLDYTEKYSGTGNNEFVVPAPVSEELEKKIRDLSVKAFRSINGSGLARVDFFLRQDNGILLVNEINTMPGLTDASGFPKMWEGSGAKFSDVIDMLIELAIERHSDRSKNKIT